MDNCPNDNYHNSHINAKLLQMINYILPYALFITICFFFAIVALWFAFKAGSDAEKEIEKLTEENNRLIDKIHEKYFGNK